MNSTINNSPDIAGKDNADKNIVSTKLMGGDLAKCTVTFYELLKRFCGKFVDSAVMREERSANIKYLHGYYCSFFNIHVGLAEFCIDPQVFSVGLLIFYVGDPDICVSTHVLSKSLVQQYISLHVFSGYTYDKFRLAPAHPGQSSSVCGG